MAVILGLSVGWTTAPSASGTCGIVVGNQGATAPSSTTAITLSGNLRPDGKASGVTVYNKGTVANAGTAFHLTHSLSTAGTPSDNIFVPVDGLIHVPPGYYASVCGNAAVASIVTAATLLWAEIPY
jgi:hypothetical protein